MMRSLRLGKSCLRDSYLDTSKFSKVGGLCIPPLGTVVEVWLVGGGLCGLALGESWVRGT